MERENLKFVIVGHVDHGKSTLIGRLLYDTNSLPDGKMEEIKAESEQLGKEVEFAFVMDHLEEEREQNITIDTAQTFFKTGKRDYVIIDAPGHKEFLKNMITGASQAEAAILIVDAKEGVKEQTKRHAYILGMLGLNQVIVAVNKMDLVEYSEEKFNAIKTELLEFLNPIPLKPSYVIPISASKGDNIAKESKNMGWYNSLNVIQALDTLQTRQSNAGKPLRYPIQDVYKIDGKRILAGKIEAGRIMKGQEILFLPHGCKTRVKSIEIYLKDDVKEASAGQSIGITLEDPLFIERGAVACDSSSPPKVVSSFKANIFWMEKKPFHVNEPITIKSSTQEVECKIEKIIRRIDSSSLEVIAENSDNLKETEVGEVLIKTKQPIVVEKFNDMQELGRFVLVQGLDVSAGGIIIEKIDSSL